MSRSCVIRRWIIVLYAVCTLVSACKKEESSKDEAVATLRSLPYTSHTIIRRENLDKRGVVVNVPNQTYRGYTLFTSHAAAILIDMDGTTVKKWTNPQMAKQWHHVEPLADGSLMVLDEKSRHLWRIDRDSKIISHVDVWAHHDIDVFEGVTYLLTRKWERELVNDYITLLDDQGKIIREYALFDLFGDEIPAARWTQIKKAQAEKKFPETLTDTIFDVFHTNALQVLTADAGPVGKRGHVLISLRELDRIATVDLEKWRVVWTWGPGHVQRQHQATWLASGNILLFDNGPQRKWSRIVEIDPLTKNVVWSFSTTPPSDFYSEWGGGVERLPNGNTLIADTVSGRLFEVTSAGNKVWEYWNTDIWDGRSRATIYRAHRIAPDQARAWGWIN